MAVSVHLLDFYHALFERSCDAVNAMASVLNTFYMRRGFILLNKKVCSSIKSWYKAHFQQQGQPIQDAFRRGLGYAIQWYDILQVHIERQVESALQVSDTRIHEYKKGQSTNPTPPQPTVQTAINSLYHLFANISSIVRNIICHICCN